MNVKNNQRCQWQVYEHRHNCSRNNLVDGDVACVRDISATKLMPAVRCGTAKESAPVTTEKRRRKKTYDAVPERLLYGVCAPLLWFLQAWIKTSDENKGKYKIKWTIAGDTSAGLLHYALPHHQVA